MYIYFLEYPGQIDDNNMKSRLINSRYQDLGGKTKQSENPKRNKKFNVLIVHYFLL